MVFIKLIKSIDSKKEGCNSKCYFLNVKVCGNFLILVQSESIHILEGTTIVQYFIDYRLNYDGTYSLRVPLISNYQLKGKYYSEIDVDMKNMQIENQVKTISTENIEIKNCGNGKKKSLSMSCIQVSKSINNQESILIVRQPTKIEFINYQKSRTQFVIDFKEMILSSGWRQPNQLVILNELNQLTIIEVVLGQCSSSCRTLKKFDLNSFGQSFLSVISGNIIFGDTFALELTSEMELRNFTKSGSLNSFQGERSQNVINQESQQIRLRNMKVIQLDNDSWVFIRNQHENLISLNNQQYYAQLLKDYEVTYLTISHFKYGTYNKINEIDKKYVVVYQIMCLCAQERINNKIEQFMILFQSIESSNPSNHVLIPFMKLVDFKDELIYAEFLTPYDLIFHDCKGSVGIVQFTVTDLGEKQL